MGGVATKPYKFIEDHTDEAEFFTERNLLMNTDGIRKLIIAGEGQLTEYKSSFDKEAIESISAFASTKGGKLLIGIQDDGTPAGQATKQVTEQAVLDFCIKPRRAGSNSRASIDAARMVNG